MSNNELEVEKKYKKKCKELPIKHLKYLFGDYPVEILSELQYDHISIYSITPWEFAEQITDLLRKSLKKILNKDLKELFITEMTACIGGNVISFARHFKKVNAIELCEERFNYLNRNLKIFNVDKNVLTIKGDSLIEIANPLLRQDVIFFDIPWGGRSYKFKEEIDLFISKKPSYVACNLVKKYTKVIVMKIPNNFNLKKFKHLVDMEIYQVFELQKFKLIILI